MQTIKLNLIPQGVNPTCYSSQYDTGRVIRVLLFEGVTPYTLSNSESVSLSVRKPDNTLVTTSVVNTEAEYVDIVTTEQMTAVTGVNICELKITEGSKVIGSLNFNMQVELDPTAHGIPSGSALDNLQEQVDTCVENSLERLYDGSSVSFDSEPTASHNAPYTVTSAGIKTALDTKANSSDLNNYYNKTQVDNALDNLTASGIGYDNTNTGLTSDKVQGAIDEVLAQVPLNATGLSYSNTQSGLQSDNVQSAIDELASQSTDVSYSSNQSSGNKIGDLTIDGETTSLYTGEISPSTQNFAPDYDDTATYNTNDKVIYQGLLYVCLEDSVTGAWDSTKWQQISVADFTADLLPIESGSVTNTKDYIDSKTAVSRPTVTVTPSNTMMYENSVKYGKMVSVTCAIRVTASANQYTHIATVTEKPVDTVTIPSVNNVNGTYCGMINISYVDGKINLYSLSALSNATISFTVTYYQA